MEDIGPRLGRFSTTARLFTLVNELPRDKQLILLKGLLGDRMVTHLYQLVLDLSEEQQQHLMDQLLESPSDGVARHHPHAGRRTRRPSARSTAPSCRLRAVCAADGGTFEAVITDISLVGMFIKTERALPARPRPVRISCRLPGVDKPLILRRPRPAQRTHRDRRAAEGPDARSGKGHPSLPQRPIAPPPLRGKFEIRISKSETTEGPGTAGRQRREPVNGRVA